MLIGVSPKLCCSLGVKYFSMVFPQGFRAVEMTSLRFQSFPEPGNLRNHKVSTGSHSVSRYEIFKILVGFHVKKPWNRCVAVYMGFPKKRIPHDYLLSL